MTTHDETIIGLETRFWQAMADKDTQASQAMIADECLFAGPMGTMRFNPEKYGEMTRDGKWTLRSFEFSDVAVIFPAVDVAVIAYTVHQQGDMKSKPMDMRCADSSTWVRVGRNWKCALHTETILAEPSKPD